MDIAERLGRYTYVLDGHLLWGGATDSGGYGHLSVDGQLLSAHRVAWELENGLIPEGAHVLHHCDIPPCLEPTHLFLGTPLDNNHDMWSKGRWQSGNSIKTHCPQGHEYSEENTRIYRGHRHCRICNREQTRRWHG
ncbi:hypothetical protein LCGC14_2002120 [marine sediment metagenome]|uniref:HNH nuclease domain-containing protein n=1 Tax=marine sediment metagenome TaxID=412755 RepID=A0A0F9I001_9ZZZZ